LDNLTLDEINALLIDAGETVQVTSARFIQINASNEAQYIVTYGEGRENHVFVYDLDGTTELSFSDFDVDEGAPVEQPYIEEDEEL
jgi:hypothetical protein